MTSHSHDSSALTANTHDGAGHGHPHVAESAHSVGRSHAPDHHDHHADGPEGHEHRHGSHDHDHDHDRSTGLRGFLASIVKPHSHDSADSVDSALESNAVGIRALKISLVGLGVTALAQLVVVLFSGSVALLADTIHNFSDALTAVPLWIAFALARRAASRRYNYGYGRFEDIAGLFIVFMIALSSVLAGYESVRRLIDRQAIDYAWAVLAAGVIGFLGNELVALYRIRVGQRIGSAALVADGLHARTDGFTSLAVAMGAIGVLLGFPIADPIVGILITIAILFVLRGAARDVYRRLMDAVDPALVDRAEASLRGTPGVVELSELRLRWIGHRMRAEAAVSVDPALSLAAAHAIGASAEHQLLHAVPRLDAATIAVSPAGAIDRPHAHNH